MVVHAGEPPVEGAIFSPPAGDKITSLYWGDTHLHTSLSADAHTMETCLDKDRALRFTRGETAWQLPDSESVGRVVGHTLRVSSISGSVSTICCFWCASCGSPTAGGGCC
jgi:hypothetical protein